MEEVEGKTEGNLGDGENTPREEVVAGCSKSPPSSEVSEGTGDEDVNAGNKFLPIFQFDLVVEKTLSYLNFEDMRALSETSKEILDAVRNTTQFSKRVKLKICEEVIQNGFLKECTIPWKHFTIDLDLLAPVEAVDLLGKVLEGAESVYLKSHHCLQDGRVACCLEKVLTKTKNLKTLGLDVNIMNHKKVFWNVEIQLVLSNLQCLEIRNFNNPSIRYYEDVDIDEDIAFHCNFLQLSTVPLNLKSLLLGKEYAYLYGSEESTLIPRIVESTKNTLQDLELHYDVWKLEEMKRIRCPNLKRLTLSTVGYHKDGDGEVVETFLKNQPPLEELDISFIRGFPVRIFVTMQGMLMKMKKLHLKAPRFTGRSGQMDWQFLEKMTELKDFALRKPRSGSWSDDDDFENYGYGEAILLQLPATTEKISLQRVPFWRYDREDAEENIGDLLARFENLKELDLLRCIGSVTNDGLQSLISNCRKLVSLTFSHCYELTDYGISGVHPREKGKKTDSEGDNPESKKKKTGVSLEELTGLIHLKIRSCPNIHYETLLHVVKFQFLQSFDYYESVSLPKDFLYQIVRQNRCLESIALHMVSEDKESDSEDHDSEYLNELKKETKQINSRVHLFKLQENRDWEDDNDSDCDLDDLITDRRDMNSSRSDDSSLAEEYRSDENELDYNSPNDYESDSVGNDSDSD